MNYLAHVYLADDSPLSLLGNLMGDFVKGRDRLNLLPVELQRGVRLHRHIDSFTDHHPTVHRAIRRISGNWGWYSGIILDVYFDHLLTLEWDRWSDLPLRDFCDHVYDLLRTHPDVLDTEMREMGEALIRNDRLMSYSKLDGIEEALRRISIMMTLRMPHKPIRLQDAMPELALHHDAIRADFDAFFPELIAFAHAKNCELGYVAVAV